MSRACGNPKPPAAGNRAAAAARIRDSAGAAISPYDSPITLDCQEFFIALLRHARRRAAWHGQLAAKHRALARGLAEYLAPGGGAE